jgi:hypothetical protein
MTADVQQMITPSRIGQGTAVEQSRAIAEVQASIIVSRQFPRNVAQAIADMRDSCRRKELADRAFFRYPQGGQIVSGPSVHLARELARVWGNFQYGAVELRRDDEYGQSEMLAFAWDVQTNTRNSSVVINPHKGYTGGRDLTDLRQIYENNANVISRRVREAILASLPTWFVEEAKDICAKTIAEGGGVPLPQRVANAVEVFGNLGITIPQLEAKIGATTEKWTDHDVANLRVIRQSLLRGEVTKDEEFPPPRVTIDEITGGAPVQPAAETPAAQQSAATPAEAEAPETPARAAPSGPDLSREPGSARKDQVGRIESRYASGLGFKRAEAQLALGASEQILGRDLTGPYEGRAHSNLSEHEATLLIDTLDGFKDRAQLTEFLTTPAGGGSDE